MKAITLRGTLVAAAVALLAAAVHVGPAAGTATPRVAHPARAEAVVPIKHVVLIYQENHSFDNVLGPLCVQDARCDGAISGTRHDGSIQPLSPADDFVPGVNHSTESQRTAINSGAMNGFDLIKGCEADT